MGNNILIIDNDKDICSVLERNLATEGYRTATAFNGFDGISKLKRDKYDLVILDLKLPDIYGTEVLKEIRSFNKSVAIVVLTGYPTIETAVETLKNHASDYIRKPFEVRHLKSVIQKELLRKSAQEKLGITDISGLGQKIKKLRKINEMSLDDLAAKTQLSKSFLSEVERKKKYPRLSTLQNIAEKLGVNIYFLFSEQ